MSKLQTVFSQAHYFTGKVCEGSRRDDEAWRWRRDADLEEIKNILSGFKSRLEERGLSVNTYDSIKYLYESLEYPISELGICFKRSQEGREANINSQTAYIFAFFVGKQIEEMEGIAKEIDEEYSNPGRGLSRNGRNMSEEVL